MVGVGGVSNWWGSTSPKPNTVATPKAYIRIGTDSLTSSSGHGQIDYPFLRFQSIALENRSAGMALIGDENPTTGWWSSLRIYGGSQQQTDDYRMITYMTEHDDHPTRPGLAYQSTGIWDYTDAAGAMAEAVTYWSKQDGSLGYISNYGSNHHWYNNPQHGVTEEQMMSLYGGTSRVLQIGSATQSYNLNVIGNLSKSSGTFDIEHPTVEGKRLRHSFIEGPQADLIYRGTAELGAAPMVIDMDTEFDMTAGTWEALNCTPWSMVSASGKVVEWEFEGSTLTITGDEGTTCMWMVIGERHDPHMKGSDCDVADDHGRLIVEYDAPDPLPVPDPIDIL
jgi:hypothetical protein